jgi:putative ABC transport system substrate-binding protein
MKAGRAALVVLLVVGVLATSLAAEAQEAGKPRSVGVLSYSTPAGAVATLEALRVGLGAEGYLEGQNVRLELRTAEGRADRLPLLARELVAHGVEVIFVSTTPGARAAKSATTTIPVVFVQVSDPVGSGLVASLARPGGNLTGLTNINVDLADKRMDLLKAALPHAKRIAVLVNPTNPAAASLMSEVRSAASTLGMELYPIEAQAADQFEHALAAARRSAAALMLIPDPLFYTHRASIAAQANAARLPLIGWVREWTEAGALLSYGPDNVDIIRRAGVYMGRILNGATPADLPIEQPTKFDLVINLKTAKALGLTIPPSLLLRADQVIE